MTCLTIFIPLFREAANGGGKQSFLTSQGDKKHCRWKQHNRVLIKTPKETGSFSNNDKENLIKLDCRHRAIIRMGQTAGKNMSFALIDKMILFLSFMAWLFSLASENWTKYKGEIVSICGERERCTKWESMEETLQLALWDLIQAKGF